MFAMVLEAGEADAKLHSGINDLWEQLAAAHWKLMSETAAYDKNPSPTDHSAPSSQSFTRISYFSLYTTHFWVFQFA